MQRGREMVEERDTPRLRQAFTTLLARSRRWPAPVDLIEALPRWTEEQKQLSSRGCSPEVAAAALAKLKTICGGAA